MYEKVQCVAYVYVSKSIYYEKDAQSAYWFAIIKEINNGYVKLQIKLIRTKYSRNIVKFERRKGDTVGNSSLVFYSSIK